MKLKALRIDHLEIFETAKEAIMQANTIKAGILRIMERNNFEMSAVICASTHNLKTIESLLMQYRKNGRLRKKCNIELANYNEPEDLMPHLQIIVCYKENEEKILLEIANLLLSQHKKKSSSNLELKKCISLYRISNIKFYVNHVISKAIAVRYCGDLSKICNIKQQSN